MQQVVQQHCKELEKEHKEAIMKLVTYISIMPCAGATNDRNTCMSADLMVAVEDLIDVSLHMSYNSPQLRKVTSFRSPSCVHQEKWFLLFLSIDAHSITMCLYIIYRHIMTKKCQINN